MFVLVLLLDLLLCDAFLSLNDSAEVSVKERAFIGQDNQNGQSMTIGGFLGDLINQQGLNIGLQTPTDVTADITTTFASVGSFSAALSTVIGAFLLPLNLVDQVLAIVAIAMMIAYSVGFGGLLDFRRSPLSRNDPDDYDYDVPFNTFNNEFRYDGRVIGSSTSSKFNDPPKISVSNEISSYATVPRYSTAPSNAPSPSFAAAPIYHNVPRYHAAPSFAAASSFPVDQSYSAAPRYDTASNFAVTPRYNNAPNYVTASSYAASPRYDTDRNYVKVPRYDTTTASSYGQKSFINNNIGLPFIPSMTDNAGSKYVWQTSFEK